MPPIKGLKEALRVSTDTAVNIVSAVNGYYGDNLIKILLPPEADVCEFCNKTASEEILPKDADLKEKSKALLLYGGSVALYAEYFVV